MAPRILLMLILMAATKTSGTMALRQLTIPELTARSDLVLHGAIWSVRSEMVRPHGIFTRIQVTPIEVLKGALSGDTVALRLYGGAWGDLRTIVDGQPCMNEGEEVVVFLVKNGSDTYGLVNLAEGKFSIRRTDASGAAVSRDLAGIMYVDPGTPSQLPTDLAGLRAAVLAAAH